MGLMWMAPTHSIWSFIIFLSFLATSSLSPSASTPANSTEDHSENHSSKLQEEEVELIEQLRKVRGKVFSIALERWACQISSRQICSRGSQTNDHQILLDFNSHEL